MPIRKMTATDAYAALKEGEFNNWPLRGDLDDRFAHYADPAVFPRFLLEPGQRIFTIGSCFARNIERHLESAGFDIPTLGLTVDKREWGGDPVELLNNYVPQAIAPQIRWAFDLERFDVSKHCVELYPGRYIDLQMPFLLKAMSEPAVRDFRERINAIYRALATSHVVLITLGLIEAWFDNRAKRYVNCAPPKTAVRADPNRFELHVLEYNEVLASMRELLALLGQVCPADHRVILTVSPVPLTATFTASDVAVANTYSKSVLRSVVEVLVAERENIDYFPSYESVTLTDRSIAYGYDQIHVVQGLVKLNLDRMMRRYVSLGDGETADAIVARAREERQDGRAGVALKTLQAGWRRYPADRQLAFELATAYRRVKRDDLMEKLLLELLEKRDDPRARLLLATYYNEVARYEEAARQSEQGMMRRKDNLHLSVQRAMACFHLERLEEGLAVLDELTSAWGKPHVMFWKGRFQERLGRAADAEVSYRRCVELEEHGPYLTAFAQFLAGQHRTAEALELVNKALAASPSDETALKLRLLVDATVAPAKIEPTEATLEPRQGLIIRRAVAALAVLRRMQSRPADPVNDRK
jgi:tetratricopeptide (TPR) repeat protein